MTDQLSQVLCGRWTAAQRRQLLLHGLNKVQQHLHRLHHKPETQSTIRPQSDPGPAGPERTGQDQQEPEPFRTSQDQPELGRHPATEITTQGWLELDRTSLNESVLVRTRTGISQVQSEPDNVTNIDVFQRTTAFHVVVSHKNHHAMQQRCSRRLPVEQTTPPAVLPVQVSLDG